jgi:hypothetical protein
MKTAIKLVLFLILSVSAQLPFLAQESLVPLSTNINYLYGDLKVERSPWTNTVAKTSSVSLQIPFKDDFYYGQYSQYANQNLWSDSSVYINIGKAIAPLSIGVATFDGLNRRGAPYNANLVSVQSFPADTLTSRPINLLTVGSQTLQVTDSVALTFYYQGRGYGDMPEAGDSLMLDFFKPKQGKWVKRVWAIPGFSNANTSDTIFKRAFVMITDTAYLRDGFRFRFRNKSALNGDWDNWHIDYVVLDKNRGVIKDSTYDDITFGFHTQNPLKRYTSMPYKQFNVNEQAFTFKNWLRYNGSDVSVNSSYGHKIYNAQNTLLHTIPIIPSDNINRFKYIGWVTQPTLSKPPISYTLATLTDTATFRIQHYIYRNSAGSTDINLNNDTINCKLQFKNYYSFDDGAAERAYELKGIGAQLAYKIVVNTADTLRAVRIYFDKSEMVNASTSFFRLCVWSQDQNGYPGTLIYRDSLEKPKFITTSFNAIPEYTFTTSQFLNPGTYFVGFQKASANDFVIGHDANSVRNDYLYYNTSGNWTQSAIPGAVMMRIVFGDKLTPIGIRENELKNAEQNLWLYPNPAHTDIRLVNDSEDASYFEIRNALGQMVSMGDLVPGVNTLAITELASGIYFCFTKDKAGRRLQQQQRFVVQH